MSRDITPEELSEANRRINSLTRQLEEKESMTAERFARACQRTSELLVASVGFQPEPARHEDLPSSPAHLAWMLGVAVGQYVDGRVQKANRWLGYVQGSMHADGYASLEELKRANMPEGETFEKEKV
jgi:hypothetical protein